MPMKYDVPLRGVRRFAVGGEVYVATWSWRRAGWVVMNIQTGWVERFRTWSAVEAWAVSAQG